MIYLNIILYLLIYIQTLKVPLQAEKRNLVYSIPKRVEHLRILYPLSQGHHCTKLGKECSKLK
jgi:hypothetical protein